MWCCGAVWWYDLGWFDLVWCCRLPPPLGGAFPPPFGGGALLSPPLEWCVPSSFGENLIYCDLEGRARKFYKFENFGWLVGWCRDWPSRSKRWLAFLFIFLCFFNARVSFLFSCFFLAPKIQKKIKKPKKNRKKKRGLQGVPPRDGSKKSQWRNRAAIEAKKKTGH